MKPPKNDFLGGFVVLTLLAFGALWLVFYLGSLIPDGSWMAIPFGLTALATIIALAVLACASLFCWLDDDEDIKK